MCYLKFTHIKTGFNSPSILKTPRHNFTSKNKADKVKKDHGGGVRVPNVDIKFIVLQGTELNQGHPTLISHSQVTFTTKESGEISKCWFFSVAPVEFVAL